MGYQNIVANNIKGGGFNSYKNTAINGKLTIDLVDNKDIFYENISISTPTDYDLYKENDNSLNIRLSKNFKNISFKFNNKETLIKIYVKINNIDKIYHRGFYKNTDISSNGIINYFDYTIKTDCNKEYDNILEKLCSELNKLRESYYITYTINNYKNYFFYVNYGNENVSNIKTLLDSNFNTEELDITLSNTMSKIKKNIINYTNTK